MSLADKHCAPCKPGTEALSPEAADALGREVADWTRTGVKLGREFTFADFVQALAFVNKVGDVAEAEGHHPDIHIHWNRVRLEMWTHDIGGLSENDYIMAARIDAVAG